MTIHTDTYLKLIKRDDFLLAEMEGFSDCLPLTEISFRLSTGEFPVVCVVVDNLNRYFREVDGGGGISYKGYKINNVRAYLLGDDVEEIPHVKFEVDLPEEPFGDPREFFTRNKMNNTENQNV